jgi:hypothetical protein
LSVAASSATFEGSSPVRYKTARNPM